MSSHAIGSAPTTATSGTTAAATSTSAAARTFTHTSATPRTTSFNRVPVDTAATEFDQLGAAVRSTATAGSGDLQSDTYQAQRASLLTKIGPNMGTVDAATRTKVEQTLQQADTRGSFQASEVARLVVQVEGRASGLPASYLQAADDAQELAAAIEQDVDDVMTQVNRIMESGSGGDMEQLMPLLELVNQVMAALEQLQVRLRENYDLARTEPAAAEAKLRSGLANPGTSPAAAAASR